MADSNGDINIAPNTTSEQDRKSANQRQINLIWERTQSVVAGAVVAGNIGFAFFTFFASPNSHAEALMANAFFLVIGFYFGRTNHARPTVAAP